jgi:exodeoxyribonuclease VII small subunit
MSSKAKSETNATATDPGTDDEIACMPIEKCFEELEKIVENLESQATSLEESISLFERGMKLSKRCSTELGRIEKKIHVIMENSKGEVELKAFETGEGNPEE